MKSSVAVLLHVVHNVGQISSLTGSTIVALVGGSSIAVIDNPAAAAATAALMDVCSVIALLILHNMNSREWPGREIGESGTPSFSFNVSM